MMRITESCIENRKRNLEELAQVKKERIKEHIATLLAKKDYQDILTIIWRYTIEFNETIEIPESELLNIARYTISVNGTHVYCRGVPEDCQMAIGIYERFGLTDGLDTMKKYLKRQSELSEANRSIGL